MGLSRFRLPLLLLIILSLAVFNASGSVFKSKKSGTQDTVTYVSPFFEDNERCFKCHGQGKYEYMNENLGRPVKALMFSERIVDRNEFYRSNHKSFSCTDCHP